MESSVDNQRKPYTRSLNTAQITVLKTIYSFRLVTRSLLSEYLNQPNSSSLYSRLQILVRLDYLAVHYDKSYKLAGREAEYYVTPKGLRILRDTGSLEVSDTMLAAVYKDKSIGQDFIQQTTNLMRIRNRLVASHDNLQVFTARDIQLLDYFPKPRPDLFLSLKQGDIASRYFVEYVSATAADSKIKKRLEYYTRYYEEDEWNVTGTSFPAVLFIVETGLKERGVQGLIRREQYRSDTDIKFYTSTQKAILGMTFDQAAIWTDADESDDLISLVDIAS